MEEGNMEEGLLKEKLNTTVRVNCLQQVTHCTRTSTGQWDGDTHKHSKETKELLSTTSTFQGSYTRTWNVSAKREIISVTTFLHWWRNLSTVTKPVRYEQERAHSGLLAHTWMCFPTHPAAWHVKEKSCHSELQMKSGWSQLGNKLDHFQQHLPSWEN